LVVTGFIKKQKMTDKFTEFRDAYSLFIRNIADLDFLKKIVIKKKNAKKVVPLDTSEKFRDVVKLQMELGHFSKNLRYQINDTFPDPKHKAAWIKSIKDFTSKEIKFWESNSKSEDFELWMPKCLYDILKEIEKVENAEIQKVENNGNENNVFSKSMPLSIAIEHFKVLTEKKSKNGKPFLTSDQLNSFIDQAFKGKKNLQKIKINQIPKGEKGLIQGTFYEFYNKYCFEYFNTMQCQENFIHLLTDNFSGWEYKKLKGNFKPKTNKRL
jgi:hypothetical protein